MIEYSFWLIAPLIVLILLLLLVHTTHVLKQRRIERECAAVLAKKEEDAKKKAFKKKGELTVKLTHDPEPENEHSFKFEIVNTGGIILRNIEMHLLLSETEDNPILVPEYNKKLPIQRLQVGESVAIHATQFAGSPTKYSILLRWSEPGGARVEDQMYVSV